MSQVRKPLAVFAVALCAAFGAPATADDADLDALIAQLADPATENATRLERQITGEWSKSGSRAMDLLLHRGRDALRDEKFREAVEHFTALTDHAPDFAEGWNGRAQAFSHMDEFGLAIADIGRVLSLNPDHFEALGGLGLILEALEEHEHALEAYQRAAELNPHRDEYSEGIERLGALAGGRDI